MPRAWGISLIAFYDNMLKGREQNDATQVRMPPGSHFLYRGSLCASVANAPFEVYTQAGQESNICKMSWSVCGASAAVHYPETCDAASAPNDDTHRTQRNLSLFLAACLGNTAVGEQSQERGM